MKNIIPTILLIALLVGLLLMTRNNKSTPAAITTIDTVYITQIVRDTVPQLIERRTKEVVRDIVYNVDSIMIPVYIPIEQQTYSNQLTTEKQDTVEYRASVSGYRASLDNIEITMKYRQFNTTITQQSKGRWTDRINFGVQIGTGYGMFNRKPDVYVGFGGNYKF